VRRFLVSAILIALAVGSLSPAAFAQRPRKSPGIVSGGGVELILSGKDAAGTSNPGETMYTLTIDVVNKGAQALQFSNNNFVLISSSGKRYLVTRGRFADSIFVKPGESARCDRIFFVTPRDEKIDSVLLFVKGRVLGKTAF
jgi:hypothetical protein